MIPQSLVAGALGALLLAVSPGSRAAEAEGASNAPVPAAATVSTNATAAVAGNAGVTNAVPAAAEAPATNLPTSTSGTGETAAPASTEPVAAAATADDGRNIRFEFSDMPYMDVIRRFAQITGKPLISDVNVDGSLSFSDPQPYNYREALDTLNLILAG
ncbi:MAG: hypothetical protein KDM81_00720 [Verrucomicrobiae bacterium]|nr:hypothetical protein [Verrucomicrobiae bacterium]